MLIFQKHGANNPFVVCLDDTMPAKNGRGNRLDCSDGRVESASTIRVSRRDWRPEQQPAQKQGGQTRRGFEETSDDVETAGG